MRRFYLSLGFFALALTAPAAAKEEVFPARPPSGL